MLEKDMIWRSKSSKHDFILRDALSKLLYCVYLIVFYVGLMLGWNKVDLVGDPKSWKQGKLKLMDKTIKIESWFSLVLVTKNFKRGYWTFAQNTILLAEEHLTAFRISRERFMTLHFSMHSPKSIHTAHEHELLRFTPYF